MKTDKKGQWILSSLLCPQTRGYHLYMATPKRPSAILNQTRFRSQLQISFYMQQRSTYLLFKPIQGIPYIFCCWRMFVPIFTGSLTRSWTQHVSTCFIPRVLEFPSPISLSQKTMPWTFPIQKNGPKDLSPPDMQKTSRSRTVWSPWSSEWVPPWRPFHRSWIAASRSWAGRAPWSSEASSSA